MSSFTVITPTGDRHEAFAICIELMCKQTVKPAQWLIVDDGQVPVQAPNWPFVQCIRRQPNRKLLQERRHTLPVQMKTALSYVMTDTIVMMEDDDWYHPAYLERMAASIQGYDMVGLVPNCYYFLTAHTYKMHANRRHSSFCSMAFGMKAARILREYSRRGPFLDLHLWRHWAHTMRCLRMPQPELMVIGMKGLPGRAGATHNPNRYPDTKDDAKLTFLTSCIGDDIKYYTPYL